MSLSKAQRSRGVATVEYCIVCVLVMVGLFASGAPTELADAFKALFHALTFSVSLP
ncbi:hypothetical protein [Corticibacter populi]|uniref:hypothetical protein n=1 Tax=Corticibacter populi TaxID=1550736 RepID=UPI0013C2CB44|nr:hypothetical protein [Corticibacter populi]